MRVGRGHDKQSSGEAIGTGDAKCAAESTLNAYATPFGVVLIEESNLKANAVSLGVDCFCAYCTKGSASVAGATLCVVERPASARRGLPHGNSQALQKLLHMAYSLSISVRPRSECCDEYKSCRADCVRLRSVNKTFGSFELKAIRYETGIPL